MLYVAQLGAEFEWYWNDCRDLTTWSQMMISNTASKDMSPLFYM